MQDHPGNNLRGVREESGYSLRRLARSIDVSPSYISRIERGELPARRGLVKAIADALGLSRFDLLELAGHGDAWRDLTLWEREILKRQIDSNRLDIDRYHLANGHKREPIVKPHRLRVSRLQLERKAERILRHYDEDFAPFYYPPVPIDAIALGRCGLRVSHDEEDFETDARGELNIDSRRIAVNTTYCHRPHRRKVSRFVIAHELAHWFLTVLDDFIANPAQDLLFIREREADLLAAALLMPKKVLGSMAEDLPLSDPVARYALAKVFDVSMQAMDYRLCDIGLVTKSQVFRDRGTTPVWKRDAALKSSAYVTLISRQHD